MSYGVHIERFDAQDSHGITLEEWLAYVTSDQEMQHIPVILPVQRFVDQFRLSAPNPSSGPIVDKAIPTLHPLRFIELEGHSHEDLIDSQIGPCSEVLGGGAGRQLGVGRTHVERTFSSEKVFTNCLPALPPVPLVPKGNIGRTTNLDGGVAGCARLFVPV